MLASTSVLRAHSVTVQIVEAPVVIVPGGSGGTSGYGYGHGLTHYRRGPRPADLDLPVEAEIEVRDISGKLFLPTLRFSGDIALGATINGLTFLPTLGFVGTVSHTQPPQKKSGLEFDEVMAVLEAAEAADLIEDLEEVL